MKLSTDGESETAFDLEMKIWADVGKQHDRWLCELPCKSHFDGLCVGLILAMLLANELMTGSLNLILLHIR